jgi:phage tail-like protein
MATATRVDPYRGYNFKLEISGTNVGGFRECSGLTLSTDAVDYREGTDKQMSVRKLTGLRKYTNITLKRGVVDLQTYNLYAPTLTGAEVRVHGAVTLQDEEHGDKLRWEFENGWICKWDGPSLNATGNDVAMESIEICHEGLTFGTA